MTSKRVDFTNIYNIEPTYIHSHVANFNEGVSSINEEQSFQEILNNIREVLLEEIKSQRDFFEQTENSLLAGLQLKDKDAPKSREEYLDLLNKLNENFKSSNAFVTHLNKIKVNLKTGTFNDTLKKVQDNIVNKIIGDVPKSPVRNKKNGEDDKSFKLRKEEWKNTIKEIKKEKENLLKDVNKLVDAEMKKKEKQYEEILKEIIKPFNELINYAARLKNNGYKTANGEIAKKAIITAVDNSLLLFKQFKYLSPLIEELESKTILEMDYKQFEKEILKENPFEILKSLNKMKDFDFYKDNFKNYQFSKLMGDFYEIGTVDFLVNMLTDTKKNKKLYDAYAKLFLNSGDIQLLSKVSSVDKTSTIDVQTVSYTLGTTPVHAGWSLKLKEGDATVDLDETNIEDYFKNISVSIPKEEKNKWLYIKNNMTALEIFYNLSVLNKQTPKDFEKQLSLYDSFEQHAIAISLIVRFLVGLIAKVDKDSKTYASFGPGFKSYEEGEKFSPVYYTSYIFTNEGVFSTIDMLNYFISLLETISINDDIKKSLDDKIKIKLLSKDLKSNKISVQDLKDLWKAKLAIIENWKEELSYSILANQPSVQEILSKISNTLGFSPSGYDKATVSIKTSQMEAIKQMKSVKGGK
jgi:hypothetical protein